MNILTDEEISNCLSASLGTLAYARDIEAAVLSKLDDHLKDAARYRYLREWWFCGPEGSIRNALCPDELDAEIDAAIGGEK